MKHSILFASAIALSVAMSFSQTVSSGSLFSKVAEQSDRITTAYEAIWNGFYGPSSMKKMLVAGLDVRPDGTPNIVLSQKDGIAEITIRLKVNDIEYNKWKQAAHARIESVGMSYSFSEFEDPEARIIGGKAYRFGNNEEAAIRRWERSGNHNKAEIVIRVESLSRTGEPMERWDVPLELFSRLGYASYPLPLKDLNRLKDLPPKAFRWITEGLDIDSGVEDAKYILVIKDLTPLKINSIADIRCTVLDEVDLAPERKRAEQARLEALRKAEQARVEEENKAKQRLQDIKNRRIKEGQIKQQAEDEAKSFDDQLRKISENAAKIKEERIKQQDESEAKSKEEAKEALEKAKKGDSGAMVKIGRMLWLGNGIEKNQEEAFRWIEKSAKDGNAEGLYMMGVCHGRGIGVEKNQDLAMKCYQEAAEKGSCDAMVTIGNILSGEKDYGKSMEWMLRAAENGNAEAMANVGFYYAKGYGVESNNTAAVEWYKKAIAGGHKDVEYLSQQIIECLAELDGEKEESERQSVAYYNQVVALGYTNLAYNVGSSYRWEKRYQKEVEWYQRGAVNHDYKSMFALSDKFRFGWSGFEKSVEKADAICAEAIACCLPLMENGDVEAMMKVAFCLRFGQGIEKNPKQAFTLYEIAADVGGRRDRGNALYELGQCWEQGVGVDKDQSKALELYREAAGLGNYSAKKKLK